MSCSDECVKSKLSPWALGLAFGVIKGLCLMLYAWGGWLFGYGMPMIEHIASFYHGYGASLVGGLIGGVYGFVGGLIHLLGLPRIHGKSWQYAQSLAFHSQTANRPTH